MTGFMCVTVYSVKDWKQGIQGPDPLSIAGEWDPRRWEIWSLQIPWEKRSEKCPETRAAGRWGQEILGTSPEHEAPIFSTMMEKCAINLAFLSHFFPWTFWYTAMDWDSGPWCHLSTTGQSRGRWIVFDIATEHHRFDSCSLNSGRRIKPLHTSSPLLSSRRSKKRKAWPRSETQQGKYTPLSPQGLPLLIHCMNVPRPILKAIRIWPASLTGQLFQSLTVLMFAFPAWIYSQASSTQLILCQYCPLA